MRLPDKPGANGYCYQRIESRDFVAGIAVRGEEFTGTGNTPWEAQQVAKSAYEAVVYARKGAMLRSIEATRLGQLSARPGFGRMPALTGCP